MVIKLMKTEKPEYMVFCYDRKEPSFRHEMYIEYKAHRAEMPDDLAKQMPYLKQVAGLLGIPSLEIPSYEADDLIGTLTHLGLKNKMEVYLPVFEVDLGVDTKTADNPGYGVPRHIYQFVFAAVALG